MNGGLVRVRVRGMSIVEVLVTLVVVTMLFMPIFLLITQSHRRALRGGDETIATVYATDVIELVRGGPYDAFFPEAGSPETNLDLRTVFGRSNYFRGYDASRYDDRFTITVDVGRAGEMDPRKLKEVKVKVAWRDKVSNERKAIKVVTFYSSATL
jgi:hypothetical protein